MRRRIITASAIVGILVGVLGTFGPARAKVYIDIDAPGFRKFPVAVPEFVAVSAKDTAAAEKARNALLGDLAMAGIFDVLSPARYTPNPDPGTNLAKTNYAAWKKAGADAVIRTTYEVSGNNIVVEMRLVDVAGERLVFGRKYKAGKNDFTRVIHKFSDDLMLEYTGEKGIFQTMIAFVTDLHGKKEIYIMDLDGNNKARLTNNRVIDLSPAWSPDSTKIVYCSFKQRAPKVFMMNIKTASDRLIAGYEGINIGPCFSPNGGGHRLHLEQGLLPEPLRHLRERDRAQAPQQRARHRRLPVVLPGRLPGRVYLLPRRVAPNLRHDSGDRGGQEDYLFRRVQHVPGLVPPR